jgi:hypothetical protein
MGLEGLTELMIQYDEKDCGFSTRMPRKEAQVYSLHPAAATKSLLLRESTRGTGALACLDLALAGVI